MPRTLITRGRQLLLCMTVAAAAALPSGAALATPRPLAFSTIEAQSADSRAILSMVQDRQGFVWIGTTEGGLARHDGHKQVRYVNDPDDPHSLPGGRVAALFNDERGQLWVGTDEGLARYDPASNGFIRYLPDHGPANARIIRRIVSDDRGGLWLASWGGLQHFDPRSAKFTLYLHDPARPDSLAQNDINAIAVDPKGGVWAGTWPGGLDYLALGSQRFEHLRVDDAARPNPKLNDVRALYFDSAGVLWMGTSAGLLTWNTSRPWDTREALAIDARRVTSIDEDRAGDMWISTRTAGLLRWDRATRQFQSYRHRPEDAYSLNSDAINVTMRDRSGSMWIGSLTDGVSRANLGYHGFARYVPRDIAPDWVRSSNFVRSMAPRGQQLWLGLDDGLALFDPASQRLLRTYGSNPKQPGALSSNVIYSMYQAPEGPLWIGTAAGLNRLDRPDGQFKVIHFGSHTTDFINTISPGRDGVLWLGTGTALLRYDSVSGAVHSYAHDPADPASRSVDGVTTVLEDGSGRVWCAEFFRGGGLDMLDPATGKFRHFRHEANNRASLSSNRISSLHLDVDGTLWVGTSKGLNRIRASHDGSFSVERMLQHGALSTRQVEAIRIDTHGLIWVTTPAGLSRLDPVSDSVTDYAAEDGLSEGFLVNAAAVASDGMLYFGSSSGITAVNPAIHSSASRPPQLAITDIAIFNRSLGLGAAPPGVQLDGTLTEPVALTLPWDASMLSIEFAVLHFAEPRRNGYRYRLEGFDPDWVQGNASHPIATYTNLAPGQYRFRLQGSNNKGVASRDEIVLPITITPPLWQTGWARGGAALLLLALLAALYRWSVRGLRARARQLALALEQRGQSVKELQHKLANLTASDSLTGLANRRCFDDVLRREWRRAARAGQPVAVGLLELEQFSQYIEHYGQCGADDCLRQVAQALNASAQRAGDLVARYGAHEFALLAPGTSADDAERVARRMRDAVASLAIVHAGMPGGWLRARSGVAALPADSARTADALIIAAEQALHGPASAQQSRPLAA